MTKTRKYRAWVKWAALGFAGIMLLLTFFSNTIRNRNLPQVSTQRVTSGAIAPEISGGGQTESAGLSPVEAPAPGTVTAVYVTLGETVEAGQKLLTVELQDDGTLAARKQQLEEAQAAYADALLQAAAASGSATALELEQLNLQLAGAQATLAAREEYDSQRQTLVDQLEAANGDLIQAQAEYSQATGQAAAAAETAEQALADAEAARTNAENNEQYYRELQESNPSKENEAAWQSAAEALAQANRQVLDSQNALYAAQQALTALERTHQPALQAAQAQQAQAQAALDQLDGENAGLPDRTACESGVLSAQIALENFAQRQAAEQASSQLEERALTRQAEQIAELEGEIQALAASLGSRDILAPQDGTLRELVQTADFQPGEALVVVDTAAQAYALRVTVSLEESRLVTLGAEARITNQEGLNAQAVLKQVAPNLEDPTGSRDLIFSITGQDMTAGMYLYLSIPFTVNRYPMVVPNGALYRDNLGDFVYVVDSSSGMFGSRTTVRRVDVSVLESDSQYTAVEGNLTASDYVVTLSSAPLQDGQSVRLGSEG